MPLIPIPSGKPKIYPAGIAIRMFATKEIHIIAFTSERPLSEFAWIIYAPSTNCLNELASMIKITETIDTRKYGLISGNNSSGWLRCSTLK